MASLTRGKFLADAPSTIKSHCNNCGGQRKHVVLHQEKTSWDEDLGHGHWMWGSDTYFLVRCAGCDNIHLRHESTFSENSDEDNPNITYYPPAVSRRKPEWMSGIMWYFGTKSQMAIADLMEEVYTALQNDSRRLAVMGIRAVLEVVMIDKIEDQGSIGKNVTAFLEAGYVPPVSHDVFRSTLIEAGHAAMHRNYKPDKEHVDVLLDLTEGLLASIYVHPVSAAKVNRRIPKRLPPTPKEK